MSNTPMPTAEVRTVRIRIPIGIDADGHWYCPGWSERANQVADARKAAIPDYEFEQPDQTALVWIEVDVPVPISMVQGKVSEP